MAKVALVTHEAQTVLGGKGGGVAAFVTHFARLLRDAGDDVTIVLTRQETFPVTVDPPWRERYAAWGIPLLELHSRERSASNWCEAWPARLSEQLAPLLDGFDIAYFQDWANVAFELVRRKRLGLPLAPGSTADRIPVLVTVLHGPSTWVRTGNQLYPDVPADLQLDYIERYAARHSDLLVSPSRYLLDWAIAQGWTFENEPRVLGLPFLPEAEPTAPTPPAAEPHQPTRRLVFFGRLQTRKGFTLFVQALKLLHRTDPAALASLESIVFLGEEQDPGSLARVRAELAPLQLPIEHLGNLDSLQAGAFLRTHAASSLVVIPSPYENFPYAVIETSSIPGINLLCSSGGGIPEVLPAAAAHRFAPYPQALAAKLAERLRDPSAAATLTPYDAASANAAWLALHREALQLAPRTHAKHVQSSQSEPTVDVCIPFYNKPSTLPQLLAALERQTLTPSRVIVVNDGSGPEASAVFDRLAAHYSPRGWTFLTQPNAFVDAARNRAAAESTADFLLFIDADDLPAPHTLATMLGAIATSGDDCLVAGAKLFDGEIPTDAIPFDETTGDFRGNVLATYMPLGPDPLSALADPIVLGASMILIRREAFAAIGGYRPVRGAAHEDWELQLRLVHAGFRVDVLPEFLLYFRKLEGGLSLASDVYEARRRLLDTFDAQLAPVGLHGLATAFTALLQRHQRLEEALRDLHQSRARLLNGVAKQMLRRQGLPTTPRQP